MVKTVNVSEPNATLAELVSLVMFRHASVSSLGGALLSRASSQQVPKQNRELQTYIAARSRPVKISMYRTTHGHCSARLG